LEEQLRRPFCRRLPDCFDFDEEKKMAIKEQSQRQLKVGQEIKRIIAEEINQDRVHNLQGLEILVTIMEVQVSPDLKYADVYFVTSNPQKDEEAQNALQLAANYFRKVVASKTMLRYVPEIRFMIDNTLEEAGKIEKLLHDPKVVRDLN